jgi:hypothetical protein
MCPQLPRLSPEYSHKVGLQAVITGMPLQIRPVTHGGHAGPVTMGRNARGPLSWTRPHCGKPFVASLRLVRYTRRVSLPVVSVSSAAAAKASSEGWRFCLRPNNVIGTKWVFRNKHNEDGLVVRNKARLVAQGYTQIEGLDFGETFALVARLEAIRILLAYACAHNIKLYQMDVKSAFINGKVSKLVYVEQPPGFEDPKRPNHVYKLSKALYGLKQAPRAWYERLRDFLLSKDFKIGKVDTTLFTKRIGKDLFVCQIYVDDIIFGSTNDLFCEEFGKMMSKEFEMSMIGELSFFLGLQIKQLKDGIFISQSKYLKDMLKKFGLENAKPIKTPMATNGHLDLD